MKIEITYNNGEKYTAYLADETHENVMACLMDDISVAVMHSMGGVDVGPFCGKPSTVGKPQTNYDRFISMPPEELAHYIDLHTAEAIWCNSPPEDCPPHETCELCILDWLKQEADA